MKVSKKGVFRLIAIATALVLVGCLSLIGCSEDSEEVEETTINFIVSPAVAEAGSSVTVAGSGIEPGSDIVIKTTIEGNVPITLAGSLTPQPEVNDLGAFSSTFSLANFNTTDGASFVGTCTLQLFVDNELAATAPLEVTEAAG